MSPHPANRPHRRYNPLLEDWVLVSPHRAKRPWSGKIDKPVASARPSYDPGCYLCPGNERASGDRNPPYEHTYVFRNDFSALLSDPVEDQPASDCGGLVRSMPERGICRVICFSPRHDLTLAEMDVPSIRRVVDLWVEQYLDLGAEDFIGHVQIFENKGALMGCSNPHPHGQIWATEHLPSISGKKIASQDSYHQAHGSPLLRDYLDYELREAERLVAWNDHWVALLPFWAVWPFETMIIPRRNVASIDGLSDSEREAWAQIMQDLTIRYDNLFETSFPYSMGICQAPTDGSERPGMVLHQSFFPPLLRNAEIRKFLVGYEMSGEPQRDITPEQAAGRLRDCGGVHYLQAEGAKA